MTALIQSLDDVKPYLQSVGQGRDTAFDIVEAGFAFAFYDKGGQEDIASYRKLFQAMTKAMADEFEKLCGIHNSDDMTIRALTLKTVMADQYGFIGDDMTYDDMRNMNLFDVMDRRMGLPVALSLIAIGLCKSMGWDVNGVSFPGHFLIRLCHEGQRSFIDPFLGCKSMEAKDLRLVLKRVAGDYAELSTEHYAPCSDRDVLLRLRNNLKYRLIDKADYDAALKCVETMTWIAPDDYRLCLDQAVLYARVDQPMAAIARLKTYIDKVPDEYDRREAESFLYQL